MFRKSLIKHAHSDQGFQRYDANTNPMLKYSPSGWGYEYSQVMHPPHRVNRAMTGPYRNKTALSVNHYRGGVWIDIEMHPVMRFALQPYLDKLQTSRTIPKTDPKEAVADFEKVAPLVGDEQAKYGWLAKVFQLGGFTAGGIDVVYPLWDKFCQERFVVKSERPPLCLIEGILFAACASDSKQWRPIFDKCLKNGWNLTPYFSTNLWNLLLRAAARTEDQQGVKLVLEEMTDVQAFLEAIEAASYVEALNAVTSDKDVYNYIKQFLFQLSFEKISQVRNSYVKRRTAVANETMTIPSFKENDNMLYHIEWHTTIRGPQRFSPRQLYFNYTPVFGAASRKASAMSAGDIVKERIDKWKAEGLLPQDYEFEGNVSDEGAKWRATMRHEHWAKMPKILKDPKYGYSGEH